MANHKVNAQLGEHEFEEMLGAKQNRLLDWEQEVSRVRVHGQDAYDFRLRAFGADNPGELLEISVHGIPEMRLDISIDRLGLEHVAKWLQRCTHLADQLYERKKAEIKNTIEKRKKTRTDTDWEQLHDWKEKLSSTTVGGGVNQYKFRLYAHGMGTPPAILKISPYSTSEDELDVGIEWYDFKELANWFSDCLYLLDWVRNRKEAEYARAIRTLKQMRTTNFCGNTSRTSGFSNNAEGE